MSKREPRPWSYRTRQSLAATAAVAGVLALGMVQGCGQKAAGGHEEAERAYAAAADKCVDAARARRAGQLDVARADLNDAVKLDPTCDPAYRALSDLDASQGRFKDAIADLETLHRKVPRSRAVDCNETVLYYQGGEEALAYQYASKLVKSKPDCWDPHLVVGLVQLDAGNLATALSDLRMAHKMAPKTPIVTTALTRALGQSGAWEEADKMLDALCKEKHPYPEDFCTRGANLAEYGPPGRLPEALADVQKCLQMDPHNAVGAAEYGVLLARTGKYAAARPLLEPAVKADPTNVNTTSALAQVYAHLNVTTGRVPLFNPAALQQQNAAIQQARRQWLAHPEDSADALRLADLEATGPYAADALDLAHQVLARSPGNAQAQTLLRRLASSGSERSIGV